MKKQIESIEVWATCCFTLWRESVKGCVRKKDGTWFNVRFKVWFENDVMLDGFINDCGVFQMGPHKTMLEWSDVYRV